MEANKILDADILDIIFDGKNKAYGAYQLRKTYNSRMGKALIAVGVLLILVVGGVLLAGFISAKNAKDELTVVDTQMAEVKKDEPPPPPPPPPPPTPPPPPEIKQIQFTPPKIVKDEEVKKDEVIKELEPDAVISTKTVESDNTKQVVQAPVEDKGTQVVEVPVKAVEEDKVFTKVEIEAEYPGGTGAWKKFLERNLNGQVATDNSAPTGTYTVVVRFIVAKDGSVSDITPETSVGYGMENEAVRAIKKAPSKTEIYNAGYSFYRIGKFAPASEIFDIYTQKYPDDIFGYYMMGKCYWGIDTAMTFGLANNSFAKAIQVGEAYPDKSKIIPQLVGSYKYMIAYAANMDKNKDLALAFADKALLVDPTDQEVLANKDVISKIILKPNSKPGFKSDKVTVGQDGSLTAVGSDGSSTVITKEGKITTIKDGITTIIENGKVTMIGKDGKVINTPPPPPPPKTGNQKSGAPKKK